MSFLPLSQGYREVKVKYFLRVKLGLLYRECRNSLIKSCLNSRVRVVNKP